MRRRMKVLGAGLAVPAVAAGAAFAAGIPIVTTGGATAISQTGATLHASVNPDGSSANYAFQIGLTTQYGASTAARNVGSGTSAVSVSAPVGNLTPATTYHYRVLASNAHGGSYGSDRTFKTSGHPAPVAVTGAAVSIGRASVTLTGTVGTSGQTTNWAFQWGPTAAYGNQTFGGVLAASATPVTVTQLVTGLTPGTTFHYRLVAVHGSVAITPGADQTFYTLPFPRFHGTLTARTLPRIAASRPYVFTTTGRLVPPSGPPAGVACSGQIFVRFLVAHKTVALRSTTVQPNCTYSSDVVFHRLIGGKARRLRVEVSFHGNSYLVPAGARAQRVRLGL